MAPHPQDRLPELALGLLDGDERAACEVHLAGCLRCAAELGQLQGASTALAVALPRRQPRPSVRDRLLADIAGPLRYLPFTSRVASLFDLGEEATELLLRKIVDENAWRAGQVPGVSIAPVRPGPAVPQGGCTMFLRVDAAVEYPLHRHVGDEQLLVLRGAFREADGTEARPGDRVLRPSGSSHQFVVHSDEPCVCAYRIDGTVEHLQ